MSGELLFKIGIVVMGAAFAGGVLAALLLRGGWNRLHQKLDAEYGKRRH